MSNETATSEPVTGKATLTNAVGLHARPSVKLTQLAKSFPGTVEVALAPEGPWVDAKSPVKIMRVKAATGAVLHFRALGAEAAAAIAALVDLVERRFDEEQSGESLDETIARGAGHG
ncbi:HPr family phosphocarrier protein [Ancylobacter terrae]|uniref:HPr family phosphocarrier protein n=1 Tax=Ancylobacter sp. sgz301288 TaxID=3342077 RepID=UPI003858DEEF